jgi:hypothetical protein
MRKELFKETRDGLTITYYDDGTTETLKMVEGRLHIFRGYHWFANDRTRFMNISDHPKSEGDGTDE